jgi:hypothetical protein
MRTKSQNAAAKVEAALPQVVWETPFEELRWPMLTNLRMDPLERAYDGAPSYTIWAASRMFVLEPAGGYVARWLSSFRDFPPRQKPASFNLDRVMEQMTTPKSKN